jgi:hypothetical protein
MWHAFTVKTVRFRKAARALSTNLSEVYGDGITISAFQKLLLEFQGLTKEQKQLLVLEESTLNLFTEYDQALEERNAERQSFRGTAEAASIISSLATAKEFVSPSSASEQKDD